MNVPSISEYPWETTVARDLLAEIERLRAEFDALEDVSVKTALSDIDKIKSRDDEIERLRARIKELENPTPRIEEPFRLVDPAKEVRGE